MKIKTKEQRTENFFWCRMMTWKSTKTLQFILPFIPFRHPSIHLTNTKRANNDAWNILTDIIFLIHTHTHTHTLTPHQFLPVRPHQMMLCRNFLSIFFIMAYFCLFFFVESIRVRSVLVPRGVAGCILEIPVSWSVPPQQPQLFATSKMLHRNDLGKDDDASDAWVASRVSTFFCCLLLLQQQQGQQWHWVNIWLGNLNSNV